MKNILRILLALLVLASAVTLTAQVKQDKCPTCGKLYSQCPYHNNHPKCKTCGKVIDNCPYKGKHPAKCKTCGKTVDKCRYKGKHPKCSTCGKVVDKCRYGGNHPKCSTCGKIVDNCQYGGNHPKCSTCGKVVDNCRYGGNHPKCSTCGKVIENCQYGGNHPKCSTCGKVIENCQYGGNHPKCIICGTVVDKCPYGDKHQDIIIQQAIQDMVYVEGGTFKMGKTKEQASDAEDDEKPAHQVTLSGFYISKYEVTQELWLAVMGSNPSEFKGDLKRPVENVSWKDCQAFISKLNEKTGKQFRLPTEAQWEYAARGGNRSGGYKYAGSNDIDDVAWYHGNAYDVGVASPDYGTHAVGTKSPNELGLYDMTGNVREWCQDWYGEDYYKQSPSNNPTGPTSGSYRVNRGGGWSNFARYCRVSNRDGVYPSDSYYFLGLRLAL